MPEKYSRRRFLKGAALVSGAALAAAAGSPETAASAQAQPNKVYFPLVGIGAASLVVHVHNPAATSWHYNTSGSWYGNAVSQGVVDGMLESGLKRLTGRSSGAAAWGVLLPGYTPGKKIAVKINLNNASKEDGDNSIDALPQVINALVGSLIAGGVAAADVQVYDALRPLPKRIWDLLAYKGAGYYDNGGGYAPNRATFNASHSSLRVSFDTPGMAAARYLTDLLYQASYVINLPILKRHGTHPVTLGFKNHFGSLSSLGGTSPDNPHNHISPGDSNYSPAYSPLVDINANVNLKPKTVLTLGDGLFGASSVGTAPARWTNTFSSQSPNSLLLSRDPVAIDCVMCDLLRAEWGLNEAAYDYLRLAESRGLGRFERGDPWGAGYGKISYAKIEQ